MRDTSSQDTVVALILRLVLGAIFVYHGVEKIAPPENVAGTVWAINHWQEQARAPREVLQKLDNLYEESTERKQEIKDKLEQVYAKAKTELPFGLEYAGLQMAVAWGELLAGITLLLGLLTRLSALAMIIIQVGAIATVTWDRGFSLAAGGGFEYNLALMAMCAVLVIMGGGYLSVDHQLRHRRKHKVHAAPAEATTGVR
jgi:uncharacterized membrane protein YphA (DoxX/SURF4 family)